MAFIKSGTRRTLNLTIKKTGNDGSSIDQYLVLDGKDAFGSYAQITQDEMQKLSDVDFATRVAAWKTHLQATYAVSEPNLWSDISSSFKYVNGQVVRLITPVIKQYQITIHPRVALENIVIKIEDPFDSFPYTMEISEGSTSSNIITLSPESTTFEIDLEESNSAELSKGYFGTSMFYQNYADLGHGGVIQYPLPF